MGVLESYSTTSWFFSACLDENKHSENWLQCSKINKITWILMRKLNNKQQFAPKINTSAFTALTKSSIHLGYAEHASKWPTPTPTQQRPLNSSPAGYPWRFQETPLGASKDPAYETPTIFLNWFGGWTNPFETYLPSNYWIISYK